MQNGRKKSPRLRLLTLLCNQNEILSQKIKTDKDKGIMNQNNKLQTVQVITVTKKPPRNRGATWTDDEVHKLFHVWSQPSIFNGFRGEKKNHEVFFEMSQTLKKLGVNRTLEECRAKIKNLKGNFKRAQEQCMPETFKFYALMENALKPFNISNIQQEDEDETSSNSNNNITVMATTDEQLVTPQQPVQIEFELMSNEDFHNMKGDQLPIQIKGGNIILPQDFSTEEGEIDTRVVDTCQLHETMTDARTMEASDGTSLIVITTSDNTQQGGTSFSEAENSENPNVTTQSRKLKSFEICQKRRKLNSISEKMAETVSRILTQTTNSLIEEMKASEERFMKWEEKRREEEQKREAKMLKKLVAAIKSKTVKSEEGDSETSDDEERKEARERKRIHEMIRSSDDPCAATFDLLATKLTSILNDQTKATEDSLIEWEGKMQKQEMQHTENLFNILINSIADNRE